MAPLALAGVDHVPVPPPPSIEEDRAEYERVDRSGRALGAAAEWVGPMGTQRWTEMQLEMIATFRPSPPQVARSLALVHVAAYDAVLLAAAAQERYGRDGPPGASRAGPSYPSEDAAVAGAASAVLAALFPAQGADWFAHQAEEAARARVVAGESWPSDVETGLALGRAVAEAVLLRAAGDGSDATPTWEVPAGPCAWRPAPPLNIETPLEPHWGKMATWFLASGDQLRPPPPPECTSEEGRAQMIEVYRVATSLNGRQDEIGYDWADGPDSVSAPAHWNKIAIDFATRHGLDTARGARLFAFLNAALHDAGVAVWDAKYAYWSVRPVNWLREHVDPEFKTLVATPPFPAYVSGHAGFSGAAAGVLAHFLPEEALWIRALATEAALSRLCSGSHARADNEDGLLLGLHVAAMATAHADQDGGWKGSLDRPEARALFEGSDTTRWSGAGKGWAKGAGAPLSAEAISHERGPDAHPVGDAAQLGDAFAAAVVDGQLQDAEARRRASREHLGLHLEVGAREPEVEHGLAPERPHAGADVRAAAPVEEARERREAPVADAVERLHRVAVDLAEEAAPHDDVVPFLQRGDERRDGARRIGRVGVEHDDVLALREVEGVADPAPLAGAELLDDARAVREGDVARAVVAAPVRDEHLHGIAEVVEAVDRERRERGLDAALLVLRGEQDGDPGSARAARSGLHGAGEHHGQSSTQYSRSRPSEDWRTGFLPPRNEIDIAPSFTSRRRCLSTST